MTPLFADIEVYSMEGVSAIHMFWDPAMQAGREFLSALYASRINLLYMLLIFAVTFILAGILNIVSNFFVRHIMKKNIRFFSRSLVMKLKRPLITAVTTTGILLGLMTVRNQMLTRLALQLYFAGLFLAIAWGLHSFCDNISYSLKRRAGKGDQKLDDLLNDMLRRIAKAIIWCITCLFIAQNVFNVNVSAMLAGAGVLSLAVAFAAQNTIANIFGAVSLILDKPFRVGDLIEAGNEQGVVEEVGLRSTLLRALDGTTWSIPNKDLAETQIHNISQRPNFKQVFDIGLTYSMTHEQIKQAIDILHEILDNRPCFDMQKLPPKIAFSAMKDWSLNITVIIWIQTRDYFTMTAEMEKINLAILEKFNAAGLDFAFPSQTVYLAK